MVKNKKIKNASLFFCVSLIILLVSPMFFLTICLFLNWFIIYDKQITIKQAIIVNILLSIVWFLGYYSYVYMIMHSYFHLHGITHMDIANQDVLDLVLSVSISEYVQSSIFAFLFRETTILLSTFGSTFGVMIVISSIF